MRHRSTPGDRANGTRWRSDRVKPADRPAARARRQPVDDALPAAAPRLVTFAPCRGSPPTLGLHRGSAAPCDAPPQSPVQWPLTCGNSGSRRSRARVSDRLFPQGDGQVHKPVDKPVEPDRPRRDRSCERPDRRRSAADSGRHEESGQRCGAAHSDLGAAWRACVEDLQPNQRAWLRASEPVTLHESTAIIAVAQRLHPHPARGPAARPARGRADRRASAGRSGSRSPSTRSSSERRPPSRRRRPVDESTSRQIDMSTIVDRALAGAGPGADAEPVDAAPRPTAARDPAQPEVHLRDLRHRLVQPVPPRGRRRRRRGAGQGLQPAAGLRRLRPGQDPPAARDRPLRPQPLHRRQGALRLERGVHQRVHQRDPRRPAGPVQAALPRRRRAADRRHPVPGGQDPDPGGVLPHLQHAPQRQQADRADLRPRAQAARGARGPAAQPVRVGPDHRRPAARPRDPDRDPAQEGRDGPAHRAAGRAGVHRLARSRPTSASSRVR